MSAELRYAHIHSKKRIPAPKKPSDSEVYTIPFKNRVFLPSDFLLPANRQYAIEDITSSHVYAWEHRYEKVLSSESGIIPDASLTQREEVHSCAYWLKHNVLEVMRKRLKTRWLELGRKNYGDVAANLTSFTQLAVFLHSEVEIGSGETPFTIIYGKESWPPSWEMAFADTLSKDMNLYSRGENITDGKRYKGAMPQLASYELGQLRKRIKSINRRQPQKIDADGNKIKQRDKYKVPFDPAIHVKATTKQTAAVKNNIIV